MNIDGQFVKDLVYIAEGDQHTLRAGQGIDWPELKTLEPGSSRVPGALNLSPFVDYLAVACGVAITATLPPEMVQAVAWALQAQVRALGVHQDTDRISYRKRDEEEDSLPYATLRDLSVLFAFAASQNMFLYVSRSREVWRYYRFLFTLLHALSQCGAVVTNTENGLALDPAAAIVPPDDGPPCTYEVRLSAAESELLTQVYLLETLLVTGTRLWVRYSSFDRERDEEIGGVGWSGEQLTVMPITARLGDYSKAISLSPKRCTFVVKI